MVPLAVRHAYGAAIRRNQWQVTQRMRKLGRDFQALTMLLIGLIATSVGWWGGIKLSRFIIGWNQHNPQRPSEWSDYLLAALMFITGPCFLVAAFLLATQVHDRLGKRFCFAGLVLLMLFAVLVALFG